MKRVVIAVVTIALVIAWLILFPAPKADAICLPDEPCQVTKDHWQSPRHMKHRFEDGRAHNAKDKLLPLRIRKMATNKWNKTHGVAAKADWDCGDHFWCGPLKVETCVLRWFQCAGDHIGWDNMRSIGFRCGGAAILTGVGTSLLATPIAGIAAAGVGADVCVYDAIGSLYGWW